MKRQSSLTAKFVFLTAPLAVFLLVVAAYVWISMKDGAKEIRDIQKVQDLAVDSDLLATVMSDSLRGYLINPSDESEFERKNAADAKLSKTLEELHALLTDKELLKIADELREIDEKGQNPAEDEVLGLLKAGKRAEAQSAFVKTYTPVHKQYQALSTKFNQIVSKQVELKTEDLDKSLRRSVLLILVGLAIGVGSAILVMFAAVRLSKQLLIISKDLGASGVSVMTDSRELETASHEVSQTASKSAAAIEESVATLEELSSMVKVTSDSARQAAKLADSSSETAKSGKEQVAQLVQAMHRISQGSRKIEEIISVVDEIAFQTNLLALNAAVEAARAGEQGKGFAVVAEAVRSLAQRSSAAAKDINSLIKESVLEVQAGTKFADQGGVVLTQIVTAVDQMSALTHEIAQANAEQTKALTEFSAAMNELDGASQLNASMSEKVASSAANLLEQASTQQRLVDQLGTIIAGN